MIPSATLHTIVRKSDKVDTAFSHRFLLSHVLYCIFIDSLGPISDAGVLHVVVMPSLLQGGLQTFILQRTPERLLVWIAVLLGEEAHCLPPVASQ